MLRHVVGVALAAVVAAAVGLARDQGDDAKGQKAVLDATKAVEVGSTDKVLAAMAKDVKEKRNIDLDSLMNVFRLKQKGGLGFGAKPAQNSGLEAKLNELQLNKAGPAVAVLKRDEKELIKLANVTRAMAALSKPHFAKPKKGKGKKDWDAWLDDQDKASKDLIIAVTNQNSKAVAAAAKRIFDACTECHATFR